MFTTLNQQNSIGLLQQKIFNIFQRLETNIYLLKVTMSFFTWCSYNKLHNHTQIAFNKTELKTRCLFWSVLSALEIYSPNSVHLPRMRELYSPLTLANFKAEIFSR